MRTSQILQERRTRLWEIKRPL